MDELTFLASSVATITITPAPTPAPTRVPPPSPKKPCTTLLPTILFASYIRGTEWLSNLFDCTFDFHGETFYSVEAFYHFALFNVIDPLYLKNVLYPLRKDVVALKQYVSKAVWMKSKQRTPYHTLIMADAKFETRTTYFNKYRDDVMRLALALKFSQNQSLAAKLLGTRGNCLKQPGAPTCRVRKPSMHIPYWTADGHNKLGELLEELRDSGYLYNSTLMAKHLKALEAKLVSANPLFWP